MSFRPNPIFAAVVAASALAPGAGGQQALSPRNASYTIEVSLDEATRTLSGRQRLAWRNLQATPTAELPFHLYWNGWRNSRSTWMQEDRLRGRSDLGDDVGQEDWGWIEVEALRLVSRSAPPADAAATSESAPAPPAPPLDLDWAYASPDDGNPFDRTVMVASLPDEVAPGETVEVELEWQAKVPRTFARTGARGDFYFIAHWFPKLGVYEPEGWNCHQYHAATEFYSDYGVYDVTITLPQRFIVGATGREVETVDNGDGTVSHRFVQEDVHGFTWTASPDYRTATRRFEVPGLPPVDMRLLYQAEHEGQVARHFAATAAALEHYGRWYGPYPYGHVTVIDPAWGSGAGGMEYPTLFTCGTRRWNPLGGGSPEGVTIHEAGHQFWYGLVGNNEFEHAWIDEGLNTFSTARVLDVVYGDRRHVRRYLNPPKVAARGGFLPVLFDDVRYSRWVHGNRADRFLQSGGEQADAQRTPTYLYYPGSASRVSYDKTALWLATLERHLGWETLQAILSTFFERFKLAHPRPEDFFAVAAEVSGEDLDGFFDQVWGRALTFDYAVTSVASRPAEAEGFIEEDGELRYVEPGEEGAFRHEVVVRRLGEGVFPVELLMVFEDGSELRRAWDGRDKWKLFVAEGATKLDYAIVDPERVLLMDLRYTNNSRLREKASKLAAGKWTSKWMLWLQDLMATFTFFA